MLKKYRNNLVLRSYSKLPLWSKVVIPLSVGLLAWVLISKIFVLVKFGLVIAAIGFIFYLVQKFVRAEKEA